MSEPLPSLPVDVRPARRPSEWLARGTLARQLVIRVAGLVAAMAVLLSVLCSFVVWQILRDGVDSQLASSIDSPLRPGRPNPQPQGVATTSIQISILGEVVTAAYLIEGDQLSLLDVDQISAVVQASSADQPVTAVLPGLGSYRILAETGPGSARIIGLPLTGAYQALIRLIITQALLTVAAVALSSLITLALVRTSLRPLNRLAQTAAAVGRMELDRGEVQLPQRLPDPPPDAEANEVGRVTLAFNHMLDNVQDALAARQQSETQVRQFVADASHELRNPLAAIRGYAELTRRTREGLPEDTAFAMSRIESESERMSSLVEDMLLLARLDNGANTTSGTVDLVEVVLNAVSDARAAGPDHEWLIDLGRLNADDEVLVTADANQLHQVVGNLLSNARKHTPAGTRVTTSISLEPDASGPPRWVQVQVADNGPGIDPAIRDHVFERFARADVARTHDAEGSTGLGLAIVEAVVGAYGGRASVTSAPGETCFVVRLPLLIKN